jgi:hypothetical protein
MMFEALAIDEGATLSAFWIFYSGVFGCPCTICAKTSAPRGKNTEIIRVCFVTLLPVMRTNAFFAPPFLTKGNRFKRLPHTGPNPMASGE